MAYTEVMKCLSVDTTKNKNNQREDRVHGGLLLLNELLRVSDVKFEVRAFVDVQHWLKERCVFFLEYFSRSHSSVQRSQTQTYFIQGTACC